MMDEYTSHLLKQTQVRWPRCIAHNDEVTSLLWPLHVIEMRETNCVNFNFGF